jgi:hypothetical protein
LRRDGKKVIRLCKDDFMCTVVSETDIITVLKSVARIRLVKTDKPSVCVCVRARA